MPGLLSDEPASQGVRPREAGRAPPPPLLQHLGVGVGFERLSHKVRYPSNVPGLHIQCCFSFSITCTPNCGWLGEATGHE